MRTHKGVRHEWGVYALYNGLATTRRVNVGLDSFASQILWSHFAKHSCSDYSLMELKYSMVYDVGVHINLGQDRGWIVLRLLQ